jgi:AcrR family transcriptional regulator
MTDADALPGAIAAAWGLRGRATRGPKPALSVAQIVAAGVRIAAAEGFGAVSMARVAGELSTSAMSLYRHVANKDELATLMVEAATSEPPPARLPGESWRPALERYAWAMLHWYRGSHWVLQVPLTAPPATPHQLAWLETGLAALDDSGLSESEMLSAVLLVIGFVRNDVTVNGQVTAEAMAGYGDLLRVLVRAERFPVLRRVLDAGAVDGAEHDPDSEFRFGLARLLDGIEALAG